MAKVSRLEADALAESIRNIKSKTITVNALIKVGGDKGVKTVYSHGGTENAVADMTIGRLTPGDLANIQEPETLYELLSDEDMENIFQFKEDTQNETV